MTDEVTTSETDLGAPLAGRSVLVTRTREQAHSLVDPLEALGAEVLVDAGARDGRPRGLGSGRRRDRVDRRATTGSSSRPPTASTASCTASASGTATTTTSPAPAWRRSARRRLTACAPRASRRRSCPRTSAPRASSPRSRSSAPRSATASSSRVPRRLVRCFQRPWARMGCEVEVVIVYRTCRSRARTCDHRRLRAGTVDVGTFTSGAIAHAFLDAIESEGLDAGAVMSQMVVVSVGPVTTAALKQLGFAADVEASESTMGSLGRCGRPPLRRRACRGACFRVATGGVGHCPFALTKTG